MATPPPPHPVDPEQVPPSAEPAAPVAPFEYGAPVVPVAPAKKGGKVSKAVRVGVLIAVAVVVKLGFSLFLSDSPVHAMPGDCVQVTGSETDPEVSTKDCADKDANYKVVKVVNDTFDVNVCGPESDALAQQLGSDKFVLCLGPVK